MDKWSFLNKEPFLSEGEVKFAFKRSGRNATAAAELLGVSVQAFINYARDDYGLTIREVGRPSVTDRWNDIQKMWSEGASAEEIEQQFGVRPSTTRQHARRNEWDRHQPGAKRKE